MTTFRTRIGLRSWLLASLTLALALAPRLARAGELDGSHRSMVHQHRVATRLDYTFVHTAAQLEHLVAIKVLVPVPPNADLTLDGVSYAYARPEVQEFVDRLAKAYDAVTGAPLVVTSLTRPMSSQPRNASPLSVHPAGMAVDLRVPADDSARAWLEHVLLKLENAGVLDVTREHHPPHLHVALFPAAFRAYTAPWDSVTVRRASATPAAATADSAAPRQAGIGAAPALPAGNSVLAFALLLGVDVVFVTGIVFAVRRGASVTE